MYPVSLRRAFLLSAWVFASVAIAACAALIFFTALLHRTASGIETALESVHVAEQLEVELLTYRATWAPVARLAAEERLRQWTDRSTRHVSTDEEAALVPSLQKQLDEYIAAVDRAASTATSRAEIEERSSAEFEAVFGTARDLIHVNVEQSRNLRRAAVRADQLANVLATGVIVFIIGGLGLLAAWLRSSAFQPAVRLATAIQRYAQGDRTTRAAEEGAAEFRRIAHHFNEMASTIERQRESQLAFLAGVAHDLRNPLSVLKMASAVISADRPLPSEQQVRQSYARVQRQIDRLERMVFDLLDAARIEAGRLELQMEECDAREIARATVDLFEPAAPAHRLVVRAPESAVRLRCDPARMEQVLNNLVSNAIKYSPRGGEVGVEIEDRGSSVAFSVSDQGLGISREDGDEALFEPFCRTGTWKESIPGVGLGLFVARRIVEGHGGRISVRSELGRGSTFTVFLPTTPHMDAGIGQTPAAIRETGPAQALVG
jgi:signal transduction histidine kinase